MGFIWKRQNNRKLLLERSDIVAARRLYLRTMRANSSSQSPCDVVYLDETYLHKSETVKKTWQLSNPRENEKSLCCLKTPVGKGPRLIIVHCGGEKGFIDGAHRIWKNTNPKSADYHGDMNADNFQDWFCSLCDLLPEPSIIVMDNASYHTTSADKVPNTSTRKDDIKAWLGKEGIPFPDQALKAELLTIIKSTSREKRYILDEIAHEKGHRILRLPPYHCDLNPIELLWAQGKNYVRTNNRDFTLASVEKMWCDWEKSVTAEIWSECIRHVKELEAGYWVSDGIVEQEIERLIINFGDLSSDS